MCGGCVRVSGTLRTGGRHFRFHLPWYCCSFAQVIDLISLKPFDMETISKSVRKTRKVIIVEECMKTGGSGRTAVTDGASARATCHPCPSSTQPKHQLDTPVFKAEEGADMHATCQCPTRRAVPHSLPCPAGGIGASLSAQISESMFNELDHEIVRLSSQVGGQPRWLLLHAPPVTVCF